MRGHAKHSLKKYIDALADYDQAIQLNHGNMMAFRCRARTYFYLESFQEALDDLDQLIELSPLIDDIRLRGVLKQKMNDHEGAISDFTMAIKIDPDNSKICLHRASLYEITKTTILISLTITM